MVSKKALIGIGLALIIIGFGSVVLIEADRLQVSTSKAVSIVLTGGSFGQCDRSNCFALGTDIPNTCFEFDSTRSCTFQINDAQNPTRVEEKEGVIIIFGKNTKCFYPHDPSTGREITDELLLCQDDGRFDKKWWVLGERTEVGLDLFVTINVIGDLSFGDRTGQLQEMGLIGIP